MFFIFPGEGNFLHLNRRFLQGEGSCSFLGGSDGSGLGSSGASLSGSLHNNLVVLLGKALVAQELGVHLEMNDLIKQDLK